MHILRENCGSKVEKSGASFEVENEKSENTQALNKISSNLNQPIQLKEGNAEVNNLLSFLGKYFILRQHAL